MVLQGVEHIWQEASPTLAAMLSRLVPLRKTPKDTMTAKRMRRLVPGITGMEHSLDPSSKLVKFQGHILHSSSPCSTTHISFRDQIFHNTPVANAHGTAIWHQQASLACSVFNKGKASVSAWLCLKPYDLVVLEALQLA